MAVVGGILGSCEVGHVFLCWMNLELLRNSVWGSTFDGFGVSKTVFVYNQWFWEELSNFASMILHRPSPGSPSKASELDFIFFRNFRIRRADGQWQCDVSWTAIARQRYRYAAIQEATLVELMAMDCSIWTWRHSSLASHYAARCWRSQVVRERVCVYFLIVVWLSARRVGVT